MLQTRTWLLGRLPFRPIIRIGCRPTPAEFGPDRRAARARQIAGARTTRLHGSAVLGSVRVFCATSAARRKATAARTDRPRQHARSSLRHIVLHPALTPS